MGARHLRIVGAGKVAKVRAPLPLGGGGLGERGTVARGIKVLRHATFPLSPALSLRGRGSQTEPSRLSTLLHQALVKQLYPVLHNQLSAALQMRHATNIGRGNLRGCASG